MRLITNFLRGAANGFALAILIALPAMAQTARVNIVHNSAFTAAAEVDVYVNGNRALDDFGFREATGYIDLPADTPLTIDITAPDAADNSSPVFSATVTLEDGASYLVVASGDPTVSDGDSAFGLFIAEGRESSITEGNAEFIVFHGATDAPSVDVYARGAGVLAGGLAFGDFSDGYLGVPPSAYDIDIRPAGSEDVAASFVADLSGAAGAAVAVLASGFLSPEEGEPSFGLLAVFADGTTALLPSNTARVQVIHNSAYAAASTVDVFINGSRALSNFAFRTATPYIDLPAGTTTGEGGTAPAITIDITAPGAPDNSSPVFSATVQLESLATYVVVASGNPTMTTGDTAFSLFVSEGREAAGETDEVDIQIFHGVTDAPSVNVVVPDALTLADGLAFGSFRSYQSVGVGDYPIDIEAAENSTVVASYTAPLETLELGGAALVVLASGFLAPTDGLPAFGLFVALPTGGDLVALPTRVTTSAEAEGLVPDRFTLTGNHPNPFNPTTNISFDLPQSAAVSVTVYDMLGRQVMSLPETTFSAGSARTIAVDATSLASGTYMYRVSADMGANMRVETGSMVLMK
jgi:hypothetical protein